MPNQPDYAFRGPSSSFGRTMSGGIDTTDVTGVTLPNGVRTPPLPEPHTGAWGYNLLRDSPYMAVSPAQAMAITGTDSPAEAYKQLANQRVYAQGPNGKIVQVQVVDKGPSRNTGGEFSPSAHRAMGSNGNADIKVYPLGWKPGHAPVPTAPPDGSINGATDGALPPPDIPKTSEPYSGVADYSNDPSTGLHSGAPLQYEGFDAAAPVYHPGDTPENFVPHTSYASPTYEGFQVARNYPAGGGMESFVPSTLYPSAGYEGYDPVQSAPAYFPGNARENFAPATQYRDPAPVYNDTESGTFEGGRNTPSTPYESESGLFEGGRALPNSPYESDEGPMFEEGRTLPTTQYVDANTDAVPSSEVTGSNAKPATESNGIDYADGLPTGLNLTNSGSGPMRFDYASGRYVPDVTHNINDPRNSNSMNNSMLSMINAPGQANRAMPDERFGGGQIEGATLVPQFMLDRRRFSGQGYQPLRLSNLTRPTAGR